MHYYVESKMHHHLLLVYLLDYMYLPNKGTCTSVYMELGVIATKNAI